MDVADPADDDEVEHPEKELGPGPNPQHGAVVP